MQMIEQNGDRKSAVASPTSNGSSWKKKKMVQCDTSQLKM